MLKVYSVFILNQVVIFMLSVIFSEVPCSNGAWKSKWLQSLEA